MKNKPQRHKDANTFKFQPFSERIDNIDVDIFHRVCHENEIQSEEDGCYFHQTVEKWNILNLTESYDLFKKEIKPYRFVTTPQLLQQKDFVLKTLLKHIKYKNPLSLQPLLDILVATAKDLRKEFYPYYPQFLAVLIELLNMKDPEIIEWTFTSLAYMFKTLWRILIKDIDAVFKALLPLLSDHKPVYIQNFASESFAFVVRKIKDRQEFLKLIITAVSNETAVRGCGKLLFEVIHGVNGQFHSHADTMLPFLLNSLKNNDLPIDILKKILSEIIINISQKIHPSRNELFWNSFISLLNDSNPDSVLNVILELIEQALMLRNGKLLTNPLPLVHTILNLFSRENLSEHTTILMIKVCILLLLSKNIKLPQEQASLIVKKVLMQNDDLIRYFVKNVQSFASFEALVLPTFLKRCVANGLDDKWLHALTELILEKSPNCESGISLNSWVKYSIDFISKEDSLIVEKVLRKHVIIDSIHDLLKNVTSYLCSIICIPHINLKDTNEIIEILHKNIEFFCMCIKNKNSENINLMLFLLNYTLEALIRVENNVQLLSQHFTLLTEILLCYATDFNYVNSLKILDMYLTSLRDNAEIISFENLTKIHGALKYNFISPYHEVRLLTTHIFTLFEELPELSTEEEKWNIFSICYNVESTEAHVNTYRDQLNNLEKLRFSKSQMNLCKNTPFNTIPLLYLFGTLYINFQLLWDPVINIIVSHAHGLEVNLFWNICLHELKNAIKNSSCIDSKSFDSCNADMEQINNLFANICKVKSCPDFTNYRLLLWKMLSFIPEIAEGKTRDVTELFLDYIELEYRKSHSDTALSWNIKQKEAELEREENNVNQDEDMLKSSGKTNLRLLIQHLTIFSKIKSPKSMYKEQELYKMYYDFLSHKNPEVQKLALSCILTYKNKNLLPYTTNLFNLIDDKNFKNELTLFRIDQESTIVQMEHRNDLIPIVMKIVFSKMFAKTGLRTGGKSYGQLRRNLILRFLAGCHEDELMKFIEMMFKFYSTYLEDDVKIMVKNIAENVDLENFIPPKRLQSTLNLLSIVFEKFGGVIGNSQLNYLLKVLLIIGSTIKGAFNQLSKIHAGYLTVLKNLRVDAIRIVGRFFEHFETYSWTSCEIDAVFEVFVWPYLEKLETEGIHSPTTLLKLFIIWGTNPRYFPLLVKHKDHDENHYPLIKVIKLMVSDKTNNSVVSVIMEMIEKLLTLQNGEESEKLAISIENVLPIQKNILDRLNVNDTLNYGSCILLPHVPLVLQKFKSKLSNKARNITQRDLFILSRISELVWEPETSDTLLQLLLPNTVKKCNINAGEETITQLLTTINNLIKNINDPKKHFKQFCPLFGSVKYCSGRKILCGILAKINNDNFMTVMELNAWDAKWVDQPDFQKRLGAFRDIKKMVENDLLSYELGILVVYNCYYFIQNEKDLSLRENSTDCLKIVIPYLLKKYQQYKDFILNKTVFALLKQWMRNKNDDIRNEGVLLIGHLARECHNQHTILRDLNKLTNKDDLEVDFFENLTHLQLHRRARALLKFTKVFKEEQCPPNSRTLTQFILPLTTYYLCNDKYANKNTLIDAAIEVVSTVSRFLPWHQYEALLKFYLTKLRNKAEFQRQLVRLNVAILDAFHYDLRKINTTDINIEEDISEEKTPEHVKDASKSKCYIDTNDNDDDDNNDKKEVEKTASHNNQTVTVGDDKFDTDKVVDNEMKDESMENQNEDQEEEEIDDALETSDGEEEIEEEEKENNNDTHTTLNEIKAYDKVTILCKSAATRVTKVIQTVLLPQLNKALAEMTHNEASHKVNKKYTRIEREEEDLLRVPISLAVVKLLQKLPKEILDTNLPGVFMKLCTFLKSRLDSVRRVARETLQKIMASLGPDYLTVLLSEMAPLLNRGFQVHVLVFTIHGVLNSLKETYQPGHIDKILLTVIDLCKTDLFGTLAEEKEVAKIVTKVSEAKSTKSYDTFQILAQFITEKCLMDLILPIKYVLTNSFSYKIVSRAQESLRFIALGLIENTYIPLESLLKFTYGVSAERISELLAFDKSTLQEKKQKEKIAKPDCFIIPKAPVGVFKKHSVKVSAKTNAHILTEFGLRICNFLLKRDKLSEDDYKPYLDPFVEVFINCLNSRHVKLSTLTLQTLSWVMKYELPSMQKHITKITEMIFTILHKYASAGLSKGDNFDLVIAAFKAMAVLVRDVKYHTIDKQQLKLLLLYCEQDLHDHDRQATAFSLIKAIIARKLIAKEIDTVMMKVAKLSIMSALDHVRVQSRTVFYQFIMTYPLGKKLEKYVDFYISQLDYELQSGRDSAIDMINDFIKSFPLNVLKDFSGMFLVTLGARLVNDEIPECRIKIAACITTMMSRLEKRDRDELFEIIHLWLKDKKISHRRMAAQLCGVLVKVETKQFEERLPNLIPTILLQFGLEDNKPGRCVLLKQENIDEEDTEEDRIKDHHLFQVLNMLLKICNNCPSFFKYVKEVQNLSEHIQTLLNYPHEWVRLASAQFLGFVLSTVDINRLSELLILNKCDEGYLYTDPPNAIKSLTLDLCAQLQPRSVKSELAEQVIKNLVFLARVLEKVPLDNESLEPKINLLWLTKRMRKIVNAEVVEAPSSIVLRTEVFKWIGGIASTIEPNKLQAILNHLLAPLVREMITTEESNAPLRQLSKEVGKLIKRQVGDEIYTTALSNLQQHLLVKRTERKRARTQLAVTDPEVYAKKKLKHQEKKKESKKRRLEERKGMPKKVKRRKIVDLELDNDEII